MLRRARLQRQMAPLPVEHMPILQCPARSLWCKQQRVALQDVGDGGTQVQRNFSKMVGKLKATRSHYQYPSLSAPQIGWNVAVATLFDGSVWINPELVKSYADRTAWSWEPCASTCLMMHYVERPYAIVARGVDEAGATQTRELTGMAARFFLHELDHIGGTLFTRRVPDRNHVVPMDGFHAMSDWEIDMPSLEARSTNLYTSFIAPATFIAEHVPDANLLQRHYEDGVFPGHETVAHLGEEAKHQGAAMKKFAKAQREQAKQPPAQ
jgi:peptide deformylase